MWWGKFPPHINSVWQQPTCICTASPWLRHLLNTSSVAHYFIILCTRRAVRVTRCHRPRRAPAEMFRRYKWKTKLKNKIEVEEIIGPVRLIMNGIFCSCVVLWFVFIFYNLGIMIEEIVKNDLICWIGKQRIVDIARVQQNNTTNLQQR